ncbi:MAG: hypothetical protein WBJ81_00065 [Rickettsiales bacterium]|jgi:hypothetical protein
MAKNKDYKLKDYSIQELKKILKDFKDKHTIKGTSKLTKNQLVEKMEDVFLIEDGKLFLRNLHNQIIKDPKMKKSDK